MQKSKNSQQILRRLSLLALLGIITTSIHPISCSKASKTTPITTRYEFQADANIDYGSLSIHTNEPQDRLQGMAILQKWKNNSVDLSLTIFTDTYFWGEGFTLKFTNLTKTGNEDLNLPSEYQISGGFVQYFTKSDWTFNSGNRIPINSKLTIVSGLLEENPLAEGATLEITSLTPKIQNQKIPQNQGNTIKKWFKDTTASTTKLSIKLDMPLGAAMYTKLLSPFLLLLLIYASWIIQSVLYFIIATEKGPRQSFPFYTAILAGFFMTASLSAYDRLSGSTSIPLRLLRYLFFFNAGVFLLGRRKGVDVLNLDDDSFEDLVAGTIEAQSQKTRSVNTPASKFGKIKGRLVKGGSIEPLKLEKFWMIVFTVVAILGFVACDFLAPKFLAAVVIASVNCGLALEHTFYVKQLKRTLLMVVSYLPFVFTLYYVCYAKNQFPLPQHEDRGRFEQVVFGLTSFGLVLVLFYTKFRVDSGADGFGVEFKRRKGLEMEAPGVGGDDDSDAAGEDVLVGGFLRSQDDDGAYLGA